jgi:hypothetical protein
MGCGNWGKTCGLRPINGGAAKKSFVLAEKSRKKFGIN